MAQRLWLGLGLILGLFALADFISLRAASKVDLTLQTLVSNGDERRGAGYNMRSELAAIVRAVQSYVKDRNEQQRLALNKGEKAFEHALISYTSAASTQSSQALGQQATKAYVGLRRQSRELIRSSDARAQALNSLLTHQRTLVPLLHSMPAIVASGRQSPPMHRAALVRELENQLRGAALEDAHIQDESGGPEDPLSTKHERFWTSLSRYKKSAEAPAERLWAQAAGDWYTELTRQAEAVAAAHAIEQRGLTQFTGAARKLDALLGEGMQPAARAELAAAVEQASTIAHQANSLITRGLLLAFMLGALAALATVRAVRSPLARLVVSLRRVADGDFAHRVALTTPDELGQLAETFNDMAEKLQSTTVSRSYLSRIVNSMGEALIVVSRTGTIQTINPAAELLLGYGPNELTGQPFRMIAIPGSAAAQACEAASPTRLTDLLVHKDGSAIPVSISAVPLPMQTDTAPGMVCIAQDLRERLEAHQRQRQAAVVFENTKEGIILTDAQHAIVLANPAFCEITGYALSEVHGVSVPQLWSGREDSATSDTVWATAEEQGQWQGEIWMRRKDGEVRPVWKNITAVRDACGHLANFVAVFSDISAIKKAEERLNFLAFYDALTNLPNRLLLAERLSASLARAQRSGTSVGVLYLDLDDFKHVNDTLGHEFGDLLLREMARRLPGAIRATDTVARLGGDEFIVVIDDVAEAQQAAQVAGKLLEAVSAPFELGGLDLRMNASIGIALGPQHGATSEDLLKAADAAMYRAKRMDGGNYQFFSSELTEQAMEQLTLKNALRHPNLGDQLVLHYQPQVSVKTGRIVGVEALVRWQHPTRGLLSPGQFIAIAESAALIHVIGEWVLRTGCAQAKAWQDTGYPALRMAINVSAHQLRSNDIVQRVRSILHETGLEPSLLELEITESALQIGDGVVAVLQELKQLGVRLALDDFGAGYSSLGSIRALPLDRLKIDRLFVCDLQQQENDRSLVPAIIAMGRTLKLEVLAEGVETYSQFSFLRDERCDEVQGYLLGKPMTAMDLDARFPDRVAKLPSRELQLIKRETNLQDKNTERAL
jgi:diguanylate cyclase (GGDEF)-like protein/PAS domain S-box-containing protein